MVTLLPEIINDILILNQSKHPSLVMVIKTTFVALICIVIFAIAQSINELDAALMPLKVVSDIEHPYSIGSDLVKRDWASAILAAGSTFFAGVAAGSYQLAKSACSPAIFARLAVSTMSVGVEFFFFWAGLTLLSASVLSLLAILLFDRLINY